MNEDYQVDTGQRCIGFFTYIVFDPLGDVDCWVAGGAVRDFFAGQRCTTDIDVFFADKDTFVTACARMRSKVDAGEATVVYESDVVPVYRLGKYKIQMIGNHLFPGPVETIAEFDFTVCCAAVDRNKVYMHDRFLLDLAGRHLVINKILYPLSTLQRLQKYIRKGFSICNGGLFEIAKSLQSVDLTAPGHNTFEFYPDGSPRIVRFD